MFDGVWWSNLLYTICVLTGLDELIHKFIVRKRAKILKKGLLKLPSVKNCKIKMYHENGLLSKLHIDVKIIVNEAVYIADLLTDEIEDFEAEIRKIHLSGLQNSRLKSYKLDLKIVYH